MIYFPTHVKKAQPDRQDGGEKLEQREVLGLRDLREDPLLDHRDPLVPRVHRDLPGLVDLDLEGIQEVRNIIDNKWLGMCVHAIRSVIRF